MSFCVMLRILLSGNVNVLHGSQVNHGSNHEWNLLPLQKLPDAVHQHAYGRNRYDRYHHRGYELKKQNYYMMQIRRQQALQLK